MYGVLQSIRAVFELELTPPLDSCRECLRNLLGMLVATCEVLSKIVSPVVCSSSPEGFLPESSPGGGVSGGLLEGAADESKGNAQSLLLCCWHTMKEVSLLLGFLIKHFSGAMDAEGGATPLLTHHQVKMVLYSGLETRN